MLAGEILYCSKHFLGRPFYTVSVRRNAFSMRLPQMGTFRAFCAAIRSSVQTSRLLRSNTPYFIGHVANMPRAVEGILLCACRRQCLGVHLSMCAGFPAQDIALGVIPPMTRLLVKGRGVQFHSIHARSGDEAKRSCVPEKRAIHVDCSSKRFEVVTGDLHPTLL